MVFSSTAFLFCFFPILSLLYLCVNPLLKLYILLAGSLFFYAWGEPNYLAVMIFICAVNYLAALCIDCITGKRQKKFFLIAAILIDIGVLGYFKYFNFFIENTNELFQSQLYLYNIVMPIGISFFIFQSLSYVADVYRGDAGVQKSFAKLTLYISFFPQLIAGPIVKYHDIEKDLEAHSSTLNDVVYGIRRFIIGLGKKVLIANPLGAVADPIFNNGFEQADISIAWLGAIAYSLQLLFDFSGYSDMAIGLGRVFGFHFLENFNYPYISKSITEFWRRWHISLGTWFKEYVYIPLGGNRRGKNRTYFNLLAVFLVTGLWHGANWTFILWGIWHGIFIVGERICGIKESSKSVLRCVLKHIYTVIVFIVGWTMFRADTVQEGLGFIGTMFGIYHPQVMTVTAGVYLSGKTIFILVIAVLFSMPIGLKWRTDIEGKWRILPQAAYDMVLVGILILSIASLAASTYNPFIYFRF